MSLHVGPIAPATTAFNRRSLASLSMTREGTRDLRLDFFRGLALAFIFIDHITDNVIARFTLHSFAFCDGAEMFIFISGYTAAIAYTPTFDRQGVARGVARIYRRAWQLYIAHLFLFVIVAAEVSFTLAYGFTPPIAKEMATGEYLGIQNQAILRVITLTAQPDLLVILPAYIIMLLGLPWMLLLMRRNVLLWLVPSGMLYLLAITFEWNLPASTGPKVWFFNPLAWQFLFSTGVALSLSRGRIPWPRMLVVAAFILAAAACFVAIGGRLYGLFPRFLSALAWIPSPYFDKVYLEPERLLSFMALAVIVADRLGPNAGVFHARLSRAVILCGQHSLEIFCLTTVLAVPGEWILDSVNYDLRMQFVVIMTGLLLMTGYAALLRWFRTSDRGRQGLRTASA
ncbi:MAG: OpgC domain-containing protein [Proteobacteria bacterium]|nr:OpgC domain-containing protein [Pseudomonadota bacterium]